MCFSLFLDFFIWAFIHPKSDDNFKSIYLSIDLLYKRSAELEASPESDPPNVLKIQICYPSSFRHEIEADAAEKCTYKNIRLCENLIL
jgi:hypothetical protein